MNEIGKRWRPDPLRWGVVEPLIYALPQMWYLPNLVVLVKRYERYQEIILKNLTSRRSRPTLQDNSRSLEPTGIDRLPMTSHSNPGPILYCFRDKRRFQSKIANPSVYLTLRGFAMDWITPDTSRNYINEATRRERSLTIYLPVLYRTPTWRTNRWTDRQTDRHRPTVSTALRRIVAR